MRSVIDERSVSADVINMLATIRDYAEKNLLIRRWQAAGFALHYRRSWQGGETVACF